MHVHPYEKAFLSVSGIILIAFMAALFFSAFGMGITLPADAGRVDVATVRQTPPFDNPGVRQIAQDRYEVVILSQAWSFLPAEIRVPAGAEVTFTATATDVLHGLQIEGTRVNLMLVPGQITRLTTRFQNRGEFLMICHEYCGLGHHLMYGKVIVE